MNKINKYNKTNSKVPCKVFSLLFAVTLLFGALSISMMEVSAETSGADAIIYVGGSSASDTNTGTSAEDAYATITKALTGYAYGTTEEITIVMCGENTDGYLNSIYIYPSVTFTNTDGTNTYDDVTVRLYNTWIYGDISFVGVDITNNSGDVSAAYSSMSLSTYDYVDGNIMSLMSAATVTLDNVTISDGENWCFYDNSVCNVEIINCDDLVMAAPYIVNGITIDNSYVTFVSRTFSGSNEGAVCLVSLKNNSTLYAQCDLNSIEDVDGTNVLKVDTTSATPYYITSFGVVGSNLITIDFDADDDTLGQYLLKEQYNMLGNTIFGKFKLTDEKIEDGYYLKETIMNLAVYGYGYLSVGKYADYTSVKEAIATADAIDEDDVVDFSAVEAAIDKVVYDLDSSYQSVVDDTYAENINDAIGDLVYYVDLTWGDLTFVYDGTEKLPTATTDDIVDKFGWGWKVVFSGTATDAGEYTVTASLDGAIIEYFYQLRETTQTFTITAADSSVVITDISNTTYGNDITLEATVIGVNGENPTGSVTFYNYEEEIETVDVIDGVATYTMTSPVANGYSITAKFVSNDDNYNDSESESVIDFDITKASQEIEIAGNADVTIEPEIEQQLIDELFTEEEVALNVEMKVVVKVDIVVVEDMDETVQKEFASYLEEYQADLSEDKAVVQATVFDISVIKSLAGVEETITNLDTPIKITINIPEEYQEDGREFFILRNHDGEIDILEDLDTDPTTITIETDRFSNYTLNYVETVDEDIVEAVDEDVVQTGDNNSPQILIALMFVSLLPIFVISKKRLVK